MKKKMTNPKGTGKQIGGNSSKSVTKLSNLGSTKSALTPATGPKMSKKK